MKKIRMIPIAALLLGLLSVTALAEETSTLEPTQPGGKTYTVNYDTGASINADKQYVILVLKKGATPNALDVNSILYIDQAAAGIDGHVKFENFQMLRHTNADVYIGGETLSAPANPYTIVVPGVSVSGKIVFEGSARMPKVQLFASDGAEAAMTATDTTGAYTFDSVPEGADYKLVVTRLGHLSYTQNRISVADGTPLPEVDIKQCAGDVDGNGAVNVYDLQALLSDFNKTGQSISKAGADIDANGAVNVYDLQALLGNFNKTNITK